MSKSNPLELQAVGFCSPNLNPPRKTIRWSVFPRTLLKGRKLPAPLGVGVLPWEIETSSSIHHPEISPPLSAGVIHSSSAKRATCQLSAQVLE